MKCRLFSITILLLLLLAKGAIVHAQEQPTKMAYRTKSCVYRGDTIPAVTLREIIIYPPIRFRSGKEAKQYYKLVRDVKKVLPIARTINSIVIETYEYLQTLPNERARRRHIKAVEKGVKEQFTAAMKKLTYSQGQLLIKLISRQSNQSSYELIQAFMGSFKASFYQVFAKTFGATLKVDYDPQGKDKLVERVVTLVQRGEL